MTEAGASKTIAFPSWSLGTRKAGWRGVSMQSHARFGCDGLRRKLPHQGAPAASAAGEADLFFQLTRPFRAGAVIREGELFAQLGPCGSCAVPLQVLLDGRRTDKTRGCWSWSNLGRGGRTAPVKLSNRALSVSYHKRMDGAQLYRLIPKCRPSAPPGAAVTPDGAAASPWARQHLHPEQNPDACLTQSSW